MTLKEIKKEARLYKKIKDDHAPPGEYFWAFFKSQFEEGERKIRETSQEEIFSSGSGFYGTRKGIKEFDTHYDNIGKNISEQCNPFGVFYSEYHNHEGNYDSDGTAWEITKEFFPDFDFDSEYNEKIINLIKEDWKKIS